MFLNSKVYHFTFIRCLSTTLMLTFTGSCFTFSEVITFLSQKRDIGIAFPASSLAA